MRLRVLVFSFLLSLLALPVRGQERLEWMEVGGVTYSNVFVLSKTPVDLWFTHTMGLANVKVKDLDGEILSELGYAVDGVVRARKAPKITEVKVDPRVKELHGRLSGDLEGRIRAISRNILIGVVAVLGFGYLFYCYCCMLICEKAGSPAPFQVWVPGLQLVPLFRAAGLPKWAISALFAPQIFSSSIPYLLPEDLSLTSSKMITFLALAAISVAISIVTAIIFCVKLSKACNKSPWLAAWLLFPLTTVLAFIYLAFSNGETETVVSSPRLVTLH